MSATVTTTVTTTRSAICIRVEGTLALATTPAIGLRGRGTRTRFEVRSSCPASVVLTVTLLDNVFQLQVLFLDIRVCSPSATIQALSAAIWCRCRSRCRSSTIHTHHGRLTSSGGLAAEVRRDVRTTSGGVPGVVQRETVHVQGVSHVGKVVTVVCCARRVSQSSRWGNYWDRKLRQIFRGISQQNGPGDES